MKTRTIMALGILLVVLSVVYYFDYRARVDRLAERTKEERLVDMPVAEIDRIGFRGPRGEVRLEKRDGKWFMTEPLEAPADAARIVDRMLPQIEDARRDGGFAAPDQDLAKYGLVGSPSIEVAVGNNASRKSERFVLGLPTPLKDRCYVMDEPGMIHGTPATLRELFDKPVVDFLEPGVPGFDPEQVRAITVERLGGAPGEADRRFAFERNEAGDWVLRERATGAPAGMICDAAMIGQIVGGLASLRAVDYLTSGGAALASYGLDVPMARVEAVSGDERRAFLIGEPVMPPGKAESQKPGEAVSASDFEQFAMIADGRLVFSMGKAFGVALEHRPHAYRDRRLVTLDPEQVCYLQVESRVGTHVQATALIREPGGEWRLTDDPAAPVNQGRVGLYLKFCHALRVETWAPPVPTSGTATLGFDEPTIRVTMRGADAVSRQGFEVALPYDPQKSLYYARHTGSLVAGETADVFGVQMPRSYRLMLKRTARYFRERRVFDLDFQSVDRVQIDIRGKEDATSVTLQRGEGAGALWKGSVGTLEPRTLPANVADPFFTVLSDIEYQVEIDADTITEQVRRVSGLDEPAVMFRLYDGNGRLVGALSLGMPGGESDSYMCMDHRGRYFSIHVNALKNLSAALQGVVARLR